MNISLEIFNRFSNIVSVAKAMTLMDENPLYPRKAVPVDGDIECSSLHAYLADRSGRKLEICWFVCESEGSMHLNLNLFKDGKTDWRMVHVWEFEQQKIDIISMFKTQFGEEND